VDLLIARPRAAGLAYREAGDSRDRVVLLVHGYPESSYMWHHVLPALAGAGWRAIAPDLAGFGDSEPDPPGTWERSEPDPPGTWERHVESLQRFVSELELPPVALVTHDWGVLIGLRWACDHRDSVRALVISDGAFFADCRWHDLANVMRTPGDGEALIEAYTRDGFFAALTTLSPGMDADALSEYWKAFVDPVRRRTQLELYRGGDFEKLAPYERRLASLGRPALIIWGREDRFSSASMADRYRAELTGAAVVVLEGAGHFVWDDAREETTNALLDFLGRL
jgi:haloalkane dehalogenase